MRTALFVSLCTSALWGLSACAACGGDKSAEKAPPPSGPIVSVLELPVTLRSQGAAPKDAKNVEISTREIHVDAKNVINLSAGAVAAADRQADQVPKLKQALEVGPHAAMTLVVASGVPYETVALALATAKAAGVGKVDFEVRAPSGTTAGHLVIDSFDVEPKTNSDTNVRFAGLSPRPWSDFAGQWEAVQGACQASQTGSCAYKPEKIAEGGELKIVLHAAGQGVNVGYFRIGPPPEPAEAAPEADKAPAKGRGRHGNKNAKKKRRRRAAKRKGKKIELIDGVQAPKDVAEELANAPPATEALFQFRAQEAVANPSAITGTIKPVCGTSACGVVVQAEKGTAFVRVISLVGAAFPDGSAAPHVVFELP